ncbi:TPM domain-containing protein [Ramlibacter ginsenosidimutans]|uniref:TPM domain-containing protein n=1 Tax=Ramlibacter ginsenosidimutans TaxID=502333 RepID=A0A934TRP7_9BURK|nr:TPM domain-containing protein [Ramlibacter ginsenosidimutans]MBK6006075.1 TPM domain-containing protein [Ramlibacter ginsenosidimutans]
MASRWSRIFKHRWLDEADTRRALPGESLRRLAEHVAASERQHTGEIRIYVEAGLPLGYLWRGASPRERAIAMFGKLGTWDTEQNNGVLIYLLLADRAIEVVADRGLSRHVPPEQWRQITRSMADAFAAGRFEEGLVQAIDAVGAELVRHFPAAPGAANPNELPDEPALG